MALQVGSRLGHYDVTALIGEGGIGQVYQATDTKLNRGCVGLLKPISSSGKVRFRRRERNEPTQAQPSRHAAEPRGADNGAGHNTDPPRPFCETR